MNLGIAFLGDFMYLGNQRTRLYANSAAGAAGFLAGLLSFSSLTIAAPEWWNIVEHHQNEIRYTPFPPITSLHSRLASAENMAASPQSKTNTAIKLKSGIVQKPDRPLIEKAESAKGAAIQRPDAITQSITQSILQPQQQRSKSPRLRSAVLLPMKNPRRITAASPVAIGLPQKGLLKQAHIAARHARAISAPVKGEVRPDRIQIQPQVQKGSHSAKHPSSHHSQTRPSGRSTAAAVAKPRPIKISPTLKIKVDLSSQRMQVFADGKLKYTWKISSGLMRWRTPNGTFKPTWMSRMHYSRQWGGAPMPHSIFFHKGYAIHGTYATRALGRPASHGCVRLAPNNARTLFRLVRKHSKVATEISIVGKTPAYRPRRSSTRIAAKAKKAIAPARSKKIRKKTRKRRFHRIAYVTPRSRPKPRSRPRRKVRRYRARIRQKEFWPF